MDLANLDSKTRDYMLREIELDQGQGRLAFSRRLTDQGRTDYPALLREAVREHDPEWLAEQLSRRKRMAVFELGRSRRGRVFAKYTPLNEEEILAYGDFNHYYIRGLCARALDEGIESVVVYRAREAQEPRPESEARIGALVDPQDLLTDLRENVGRPSRLGIPGGPNSGISVRLP
jgi:hypothetical protein